MLRGLQRFLATASEWHPRDFVIGMVGVELVTLFAAVSLGFGTFAAFVWLSDWHGPALAAAMLSAAYGVVAVIAGAALARWHARAATPPTPPTPARPAAEDVEALITAMAAAQRKSPMELVAIALISGFLSGRGAGR